MLLYKKEALPQPSMNALFLNRQLLPELAFCVTVGYPQVISMARLNGVKDNEHNKCAYIKVDHSKFYILDPVLF